MNKVYIVIQFLYIIVFIVGINMKNFLLDNISNNRAKRKYMQIKSIMYVFCTLPNINYKVVCN